jgi:hypothetical protein
MEVELIQVNPRLSATALVTGDLDFTATFDRRKKDHLYPDGQHHGRESRAGLRDVRFFPVEKSQVTDGR